MFKEIAFLDISCQANDLLKSFENISLKPNFLNKLALASENKGLCSINNSQCVLCLIQQYYDTGKCFINRKQDDQGIPPKKMKLADCEFGIFKSSCNECNQELSNQISLVLNFWFKNSAAVEFNLNIRKLIPKNPKLFFCTYELVLLGVKDTMLNVVVVPLCAVDGLTSLINKSYGFIFKESDHKLSAYVHNNFDEDVPASTLVASRPWILDSVLPKLKKWGESSKHHSSKQYKCLVDMEKYSTLYFRLKQQYGPYFVSAWTESTDPLKFVYEDIAIATYLLLIWEEDREQKNLQEKQSFIDIGCGNGLLVHILASEGHPGKGVDIVRRKIWDIYPSSTVLEELTVLPHKMKVDVDWIVGNHTDELTPWIPVIAARSSYFVNYFVLPCCFYDFAKKFDGGAACSASKYRVYLDYIIKIGTDCGFIVEEDSLRIPSTKRICSIGRRRTLNLEDQENIDDVVQSVLSSNSCSIDLRNDVGDVFAPREVDTDPKNCTQINPHVKEKMVDAIINRLLEKENFNSEANDTKLTSSGAKWTEWNAGGVISIEECAKLFNKDLLKELKAQSGGLKSLLRNHQRIFTVIRGNVALRDFREPDQLYWGQKSKKSERSRSMLKVCACWFYSCHPQGCVLTAQECRYMHGPTDKLNLHNGEDKFSSTGSADG